MTSLFRPERDRGGLPRALTHPTAVTAYERTITIPARRAGMTETDWIVHRAMAAAYTAAETNDSTTRTAEAA